jgi:hypothetical protein
MPRDRRKRDRQSISSLMELEEKAAYRLHQLRILGNEHPDTILAMNDLANAIGCSGKLEESARMLKDVLQKMQQILRNKHPNATLAKYNLSVGHQVSRSYLRRGLGRYLNS